MAILRPLRFKGQLYALRMATTLTIPTYDATAFKIEPLSDGNYAVQVDDNASDLTYIELYVSTSSLTFATSEIAAVFLYANGTQFILSNLPGGTFLVSGTSYKIGSRAINITSSGFIRDGNTEEYTLAPKGGHGKLLIRQVTGI